MAAAICLYIKGNTKAKKKQQQIERKAKATASVIMSTGEHVSTHLVATADVNQKV